MQGTKAIFIAHPSILLTDHLTHGDALAAFNFIRRLATRGHRMHVVAEHVALREALPEGVILHPIPPRKPRSVVDQIRCAYRIRQIFERVRATERIDLIHQLNPVDLGLSCLLPARRPPLILGPYVPDWPARVRLSEMAGPLQHGIYRMAGAAKDVIRRREQLGAATILLSTPAAQDKIKLRGPAVPLVRYVSMGVDPDVFAPDPPESRSATSETRLLFLANLNVRKGILTLLRAFDEVARRVPGSTLRIVGEGMAREQVGRAVEASPYRDRIALLGRAEPAAVPALMRAADVFCLPSVAEPFGITVLEAMSCGKPVVTTDVGGLAHLVRPSGGRTVPPGDWRALAEALIEVLSSAELRAAMGSFNRSLVVRNYAWDRVIDQLEAAYDETLAR
jgi:glycosyltransferase involved in cell wall biosynthesis